MNTRLIAILLGALCLTASADTASLTNAIASAKSAAAAVDAARKEAASTNAAPVAAKPAPSKPKETAKPVAAIKPPEPATPPKAEPKPVEAAKPTAAEAKPAKPAETEKPKAAEPKPASADPNTASAMLIGEGKTDEIDLEDDSAEAARKPTITGNIDEGMMSLVDIECDEATLADILRQFRKTTGANIISDDSTNLQKRVSVSLKHVPWLKGLMAILGSRGFRLEEHENIYRVVEDLQLIPVSTRTFALNHASAKELAELFNNTYGRKDPAGKLILPIATSFNGANVVVVTSNDKILSDCEAIIKAVDKAVAQIYIEARFIELSNEALHKLGMQWDQLESWGGSVRNLNAGMEYNNGRAANYGSKLSTATSSDNSSDNKNTSANTSVAAGSSSSAASSSTSSTKSTSDSKTYTGLVPSGISQASGAGRSADNMSWRNARGFSGQLSIDDFRLAMSAFESMSDVKVFSNPKIIVSNGKEAKVDMTTKYPNVTIDSNYTGLNSQNLSVSTKLDTIPGEDKFMFAKEAFFSWGIQLSVTPRISPDGLISVEIVPTISDCSGYLSINSSQETDTPYTQYPIIEVKRLTTEFTMQDGATAVIGGLSKTSEEDIDSGIPYLREIPWIGQKLFGWKSRGKVQKEILVFVTIGIADPKNLPKDIGLPKNAVLGREYVTGAMLEPGDRTGDAANVLKLDMTAVDKRKPKDEPKGTVTITPVTDKSYKPSQESKAAQPAESSEKETAPEATQEKAAPVTPSTKSVKQGTVSIKPVVLAQAK